MTGDLTTAHQKSQPDDLRCSIDALRLDAQPLRQIANEWRDAEMRMFADDETASACLDQQDHLLDLAARTPALTLDDAFWKLLLWRLDNEDLGDSQAVSRGEAVALALLADLAQVGGHEGALPKR